MELYFAEGGDLSDPKVLIQAAVDCGMDGDLVRRLLASDADVDRIESEANSAKEAGIDGVPCFIFGGSVIVTGAQSPEYLATPSSAPREGKRRCGRNPSPQGPAATENAQSTHQVPAHSHSHTGKRVPGPGFAAEAADAYLRFTMSARANAKHEQFELFTTPPSVARQPMPAGFRYAPDLIDASEEARLVEAFAELPFKEFEFHGFLGKRRVVAFGFRYDYNDGGSGAACSRRRRCRTFCCRCANVPPRSPDFLPTDWRMPSSPNTGPAPQSAGTATGRITMTSSASRC